jgi:hypothetical protein
MIRRGTNDAVIASADVSRDITALRGTAVEQIANWVAPVATTIAAVMVAANLGSRLTGIGFIAFAIGSIGWIVIGYTTGQMNLVWQNAVLFLVNVLGIWRWLGLRARYDKGAAAATRATAR